MGSFDAFLDAIDPGNIGGSDFLSTTARRIGRQTFLNLEVSNNEGQRRDRNS